MPTNPTTPTTPTTFTMRRSTLALTAALGSLLVVSALACVAPEEEPSENNDNNSNNTNNANNANNVNNSNNTNNSNDSNNTNNSNNANNSNNTNNSNNSNNKNNDNNANNVTQPQGGWTLLSHPCVGNRTDALYCSDASTCLVGCGTTTNGRGLYGTRDGGLTWAKPRTQPEGFFDSSRVNDISRSADGKAYIAGEHSNGFGVVSMDREGNIGEVFRKGTTVDFSFTVGSFRRAESGRAIAESLTGSGIVYRAMDDSDPRGSWESGYGFWQEQFPRGVQILKLAEHDGRFYGAGSTIAEPPKVFLPAWDDTFGFDILELVEAGSLSAYNGEMWDIDVNDEGILLGGVNQTAGRGMVYVHTFADGKSPNDRANWTSFSLSRLFEDKATWIQGVCRGAKGTLYAVGRESREGWGIVIRSKDGGQTWEDISPYAAGASKSSIKAAYRCQATAEGVLVAGEAGLFAVYRE